jgi:hypothetical protein
LRGRQLAVRGSSLSGTAFSPTNNEVSSSAIKASARTSGGVLSKILRVVSFGLWGGQAKTTPPRGDGGDGGDARASRGCNSGAAASGAGAVSAIT